MPKVTILTPLYNGEQYIEQAILGILGQSYRDFEYYIINDGSTDHGADIIRRITDKRVNIIEQDNKGAAAAINNGLRRALGEYVGFCDQDDIWLSDKLERQVAFLDAHPDADVVYSDARMADAEGKFLSETWMQSRRTSPCTGSSMCMLPLFERNFICAPLVVLMRKKLFEDIGFFNETFSSAYDYEFWFRMLEADKTVEFIEEPLAVWRTHEFQESKNIRKAKIMLISILREFLRRNPEFKKRHPTAVFKKWIKAYGALVLAMIPSLYENRN